MFQTCMLSEDAQSVHYWDGPIRKDVFAHHDGYRLLNILEHQPYQEVQTGYSLHSGYSYRHILHNASLREPLPSRQGLAGRRVSSLLRHVYVES